jgi:WD40 repeat protein
MSAILSKKHSLEGHQNTINNVIPYSHNKLISCSYDKTIKVWDLITGECLKTLEGHTESVCPFKVFRHSPVFEFHTLIVLSSEQLINISYL